MPEQLVNGAKLFYELSGSGDPLVLVHGSWVDHKDWQLVVPHLAGSFRVLTYDRRGHSLSERPLGQGSRREDEEDLAALMEALDLAPAHVAANSLGGSIALGLAAHRPDLFQSLIVHEALLTSLVADDAELRPLLMELQARFESVLDQLRAGDIAGGTRCFVEEVALGPGMWEQLPEEVRQMDMNNAPTFLDELQDPNLADLDVSALRVFLIDGQSSLHVGNTPVPGEFLGVRADEVDGPQPDAHIQTPPVRPGSCSLPLRRTAH